MASDMRTFLDGQDVVVGLDASCKRSVLHKLADHVSGRFALDAKNVLESLLAREQLGSTGVGHGVAIPHARADVTELVGVLARLSAPVDFDAIDDQPVDLVFLLLAPQSAEGEHLRALSRVSRLVRSAENRRAMRGAEDSEALFAIAAGSSAARAA